MTSNGAKKINWLLERARELEGESLDFGHAFSKAAMEDRIRIWPSHWGDDLQILIYGDFIPLKEDVHLDTLGIVIHSELQKDTVIKCAFCVVKATVKVKGKNAEELIDAERRINIALGVWSLLTCNANAIGWWSIVTHGLPGGTQTPVDTEKWTSHVDHLSKLHPDVLSKIRAALYWIREPRNLLMHSYRSDLLSRYAGLWNAFECLMAAVCLLKPQPKKSKKEKQEHIDSVITERQGKPTLRDIEQLYQEIVNPGIKAKSKHVLEICFPDDFDEYVRQCFNLPDKSNELYQIRNDINHGSVDAENIDEYIRIEARIAKLYTIVWEMFKWIVANNCREACPPGREER